MTAPTNSLPFEQRLVLVKAEVEKRVAACDTQEQAPKRAHLWIQWIVKNFLPPTDRREHLHQADSHYTWSGMEGQL